MKSLLVVLLIVVAAGLGYVVLRNHGIGLSGSSAAGTGTRPGSPAVPTMPTKPVSTPRGGGGESGPLALTSCGATAVGGAACSIRGTGFAPGERVVVTYAWPAAEPSEYTVHAGGDGSFSHNVNPHGGSGTVRVQAVGQDSGRTANTSFTLS